MNSIWMTMMIVSILVGIANGKVSEMVNSIVETTKLATENSFNIIGFDSKYIIVYLEY